jgi:hypothetical protein
MGEPRSRWEFAGRRDAVHILPMPEWRAATRKEKVGGRRSGRL